MKIWESQKENEDFFAALNKLIMESPSLQNFMRRQQEENPDDDEVNEILGEYDPKSPTFTSGVVVVLTMKNLQDRECLVAVTPTSQSFFHTYGMIVRAAEGWEE